VNALDANFSYLFNVHDQAANTNTKYLLGIHKTDTAYYELNALHGESGGSEALAHLAGMSRGYNTGPDTVSIGLMQKHHFIPAPVVHEDYGLGRLSLSAAPEHQESAVDLSIPEDRQIIIRAHTDYEPSQPATIEVLDKDRKYHSHRTSWQARAVYDGLRHFKNEPRLLLALSAKAYYEDSLADETIAPQVEEVRQTSGTAPELTFNDEARLIKHHVADNINGNFMLQGGQKTIINDVCLYHPPVYHSATLYNQQFHLVAKADATNNISLARANARGGIGPQTSV